MGIIISRFRKKKNTIEQLEDIEEKIEGIEKFQKETEQQFRRVIGKLVISSICIYVIALVVYYYYFSPDTFRDNVLKFMPLLVFPVIIILFRKILSWYFKRKLSNNTSSLKTLKNEKKKILDEVMDKEIYKVAKEILEKYAPEQLRKDSQKPTATNNSVKALLTVSPARGDMIPRQRLTSGVVTNKKYDASSPIPDVAFQATVPNMSTPAQPRLSLPRPILAKDRGAFDKLIDMVIGDGPGNRYALICRVCSSHNGMALKNEFEYLAFRCAYCLQWNPARKQKPHAPNLGSNSGSQDELDVINSETDDTNVTTEQDSVETKHDDMATDDSSLHALAPPPPSLMECNDANNADDIGKSTTRSDKPNGFSMAALNVALNELQEEQSIMACESVAPDKNGSAIDTASSTNDNNKYKSQR